MKTINKNYIMEEREKEEKKLITKFKKYCKSYLEEIGYFNILNSFLNDYKINSLSYEKEIRELLYKEVLK